MLKNRTFQIVWVTTNNGIGIEPAKQVKEVKYSGKEVMIKK